MVKCQVESIYKETYFLCRDLESKKQGIITWTNYSRSYFKLKKEIYLGKIIEAEVLSEGQDGMLRLSRAGALLHKRKEKINYFTERLAANDSIELYVDELHGRRIYRDLSKLIPYSVMLPATNGMVVGFDNNHIYLEIEELDILGVLPINYLSWHRIKDTSKLKYYIGQTIDVKLIGYSSSVKVTDGGGKVHKVRDCFICSSALTEVPDTQKLSMLKGMKVKATVVASNSSGSILRNSIIPVDLYSKKYETKGKEIECVLGNFDVNRTVIDIE